MISLELPIIVQCLDYVIINVKLPTPCMRKGMYIDWICWGPALLKLDGNYISPTNYIFLTYDYI